MIRTAALSCLLSLPVNLHAQGFCITDLGQAPLTASLVHPDALVVQHDRGYVQILCLDCPAFRQIEVFLGVDGNDSETPLRSVSGARQAIERFCDGVAKCSANLITAASAIGLRTSYVTEPFAQAAIRLNTSGERLTIRVTAQATDIDWTIRTADTVLTTLIPAIAPPC